MPLSEKIKKFLDENKVQYKILKHEPAMTAQEVAHSVHITGKEVAKCVIVNAGGKMTMVAIPAPRRLDLRKVKTSLGNVDARLAREDEFRDLFPDSEVGAMPPFGSVYGLPVYLDVSLMSFPEIVFNACTHTEVLKMSLSDFETLVKPQIGDYSEVPI
ncbi:MAG: YbaK/EbsC family protein [Ignavibacteriae bacterium]|nr:YbaK/EbsC family protein [Ignavibacteriota bacterium]